MDYALEPAGFLAVDHADRSCGWRSRGNSSVFPGGACAQSGGLVCRYCRGKFGCGNLSAGAFALVAARKRGRARGPGCSGAP